MPSCHDLCDGAPELGCERECGWGGGARFVSRVSTVEVITQAAAWSKSGFLLVLVALPVLAGAWSLIWQLMTGFEGERTGSAQSASEADVRERGAPETGGAAVASDSAGG